MVLGILIIKRNQCKQAFINEDENIKKRRDFVDVYSAGFEPGTTRLSEAYSIS